MKRLIVVAALIALVACMSFTFAACEKEEVEEVTIVRYEINDYTVTEGDTLDLTKVIVTAYLSDDTTQTVDANLTYDTTSFDDKLEDGAFKTGSHGAYTAKVFFLEEEIGTLNITVKVKY